MTQTVAHYLSIYQHRKSMMENGITHPNEEGRKFIAQLATRLAEFDPNLPCNVTKITDSNNDLWYIFSVNNEELARINVGENDELFA